MPDAMGFSLIYTNSKYKTTSNSWQHLRSFVVKIRNSRDISKNKTGYVGNQMKIVLADEQPKVLFALNVLLARNEDLLVVGEALNADELIKQMIDKDPDLIIVDWLLPGLDEIGSVDKLRRLSPNLCIIALSSRPELRQTALHSGANAFISKIDPPERLLMTIARLQKEAGETTPRTA